MSYIKLIIQTNTFFQTETKNTFNSCIFKIVHDSFRTYLFGYIDGSRAVVVWILAKVLN